MSAGPDPYACDICGEELHTCPTCAAGIIVENAVDPDSGYVALMCDGCTYLADIVVDPGAESAWRDAARMLLDDRQAGRKG
jgi:transcription elongation factor Elf1